MAAAAPSGSFQAILSASFRLCLPPPPPASAALPTRLPPNPIFPPPSPYRIFPPSSPFSPYQNNPPKPLRIWSPKPASATALPVLLFQHGFSAQTIYYSLLLSRVASHGFIVVAPQVGRANRATPPSLSASGRPIPPNAPLLLPPFTLPLRIWSPKPTTATALPVLLFQHGFSASLFPSNPPRPLRIWSPKPSTATALPVLLFQHGFSAQTSFYSQLLTRIAKHGYIVVAPQVCGWVHISAQMGKHGFSAVGGCTLLLFQHGFSAQTSFYSQLLTRIAKHGYIVVAPQVCGWV
ncbi:unnamed protein product [Closterium sp. Naga37s-1]|nr:unnamed protein product [Closterium sp. Naga37s-1]